MDTDQSQKSSGSVDDSLLRNGAEASAPEDPEPSMGDADSKTLTADDVEMEGSDDASWVRIESKVRYLFMIGC